MTETIFFKVNYKSETLASIIADQKKRRQLSRSAHWLNGENCGDEDNRSCAICEEGSQHYILVLSTLKTD